MQCDVTPSKFTFRGLKNDLELGSTRSSSFVNCELNFYVYGVKKRRGESGITLLVPNFHSCMLDGKIDRLGHKTRFLKGINPGLLRH